MDSASHILINLILGITYLKLTSQGLVLKPLLIIVLVGLFIDLDHLIPPILDGRIKNIRRMIHYWAFTPNKFTREIYLFHTYEFFIFVLMLGFLNRMFLFVFLGLIFHFFGDFIANTISTKGLWWLKYYSISYWVLSKYRRAENKNSK